MGYRAQKINWCINRFRAMGLKEIFAMRLWRLLRDSVYRLGRRVPRDVVLDIRPFSNEYREYFLKNFARHKEEILKKADILLENRIELFGNEYAFGQHLDWSLDYGTKKNWPLVKFYHNISHIADPKYIWELNRHQFLPLLGKAFFLTGDERYAQKIVSLIESWIEQNPPFLGINWYNSIEPALRQISWLWALKYIARSKHFDERAAAKIRESLFIHTKHIYRNLSLYSSANNHLISELASVMIVGGHLGMKKEAENALKMLSEQINRQILDDGVGAEQSIAYQLQTMEYYLVAMMYLSRNGVALRDDMLNRIKKAAEFIGTVLNQNGVYPVIGDNDSGYVLKLSESYPDPKTVLNLAAYITGTAELAQKDSADDEKLFWLLGPSDFEKLINRKPAAPARKPSGTRMYDKGGYCIFEEDRDNKQVKMIFDFGPLGLPPLAGHGHADALSFALYVNEQPVFIDPGTYTYFGDDFWRAYFRGTSAHNTIRIDGQDQSVFCGRFLASYKAKAECVSFENDKSICARHYGYKRLKTPVMHTRTVNFLEENAVILVDKIESKGEHLLEQFFHLSKNCEVKECGKNVFEIGLSGAVVLLKLDPQMEVMAYHGNETIPLGWESTVYGAKEKTFSVVGRIKTSGNREFMTTIDWR